MSLVPYAIAASAMILTLVALYALVAYLTYRLPDARVLRHRVGDVLSGMFWVVGLVLVAHMVATADEPSVLGVVASLVLLVVWAACTLYVLWRDIAALAAEIHSRLDLGSLPSKPSAPRRAAVSRPTSLRRR